MTFCSVSSCRPLSNKIRFTRFGLHLQKLWQFWIPVGSCPEMVRSLRPKGPGLSGPIFFGALFSLCGAVLYRGLEVHRRWSGVSGSPESPAKGPGISGPKLFLCSLHLYGAVLDRGPEHPRRLSGVSGLAGISGPLDRILRSASMTQQARSLAGISGPLTPESPQELATHSLSPPLLQTL